ncbi:hypothetical protein EZV62_003881 [Acer yangbiense]|uniref:Uncharacterized protein n=1 Tax=Acer yangbiense TaxID=1000413 RepID=A0A5C7IKG4_9ROSI|nr:hypothetical protein EZV62_003881 [Acer yangbiense]
MPAKITVVEFLPENLVILDMSYNKMKNYGMVFSDCKKLKSLPALQLLQINAFAWSNRSSSSTLRQVFNFQESYGGVVKDRWSRAGELIADFKTGGKVVAFHYVLNLMRWEWWIYVMRPVSLGGCR